MFDLLPRRQQDRGLFRRYLRRQRETLRCGDENEPRHRRNQKICLDMSGYWRYLRFSCLKCRAGAVGRIALFEKARDPKSRQAQTRAGEDRFASFWDACRFKTGNRDSGPLYSRLIAVFWLRCGKIPI
jgi:hypothetical protein